MTSQHKTILLVAGFLVLVAIFSLNAVAASPPRQDPEFAFVVTTTEDHNDGLCDADCSLRDAIIAANKTEFHDTILLPSGSYTLTLEGAGEDDGMSGDLDIRYGLTIIGECPETTIIDAGGLISGPDRVFDIHSIDIAPYSVDLSSLTITGGDAGAQDGGGIRTHFAELVLHNSTVRANSAQNGGGIHTHGRLVQLIDSTVSENSAADCGGGIFNDWSILSLLQSTISDNDAGEGGGIFHSAGTLYLDHSTIEGNTAETKGGGIHHEEFSTWANILKDSTIRGNSAGTAGGGISNDYCGELNLYNTTVSGNSAGTMGGGIAHFDGHMSLYNTTVSENSAPIGGGIHCGASAALKNTVVASNPSGGDCDITGGILWSNGHNLDSDNTCSLTATGDLPNTDPRLGPLQDNGGPTLTHALLFHSPAIDAGDNSDCPATDQRGFLRPMDGDGDGTATCDIGAFEHLGLRARFPLMFSSIGPSP